MDNHLWHQNYLKLWLKRGPPTHRTSDSVSLVSPRSSHIYKDDANVADNGPRFANLYG